MSHAVTLLRQVTLHSRDAAWPADVALVGERFGWLGEPGTCPLPVDRTRDLDGLTLLPGLVDAHVHCREPGGHAYKGTYASESRAAAAGGVTTFLTMPNTAPHTKTAAVLETVRAAASAGSLIDYGLQFMVTPDNLDEVLAVRGVPAFKLYMDPTTGIANPLADEGVLRRVMATGVQLTAHAEADTLDFLLGVHARWGLGPLHICHVSLAREVESLRQAKRRGQWVTAEVAPHHLFLDERDFARLGPFADMRPTLKSPADVDALWAGLADGTFDTLATDHAPHTREDKAKVPAPPGVPGLQTLLPLLLDAAAAGRLSLDDLARLASRNPARIFGLAGKGALRVGADADFVLVDTDAVRTIRDEDQLTLPGWTPYAGRTVRGAVVETWRRGATIFADGRIVGTGGGREVSLLSACGAGTT